MSLLSCDYQILSGQSFPLPICNLHLLGPNGKVLVRALIDSGATHPIFPEKAAEDAGIGLPRYANFTIRYGGSITPGRKVKAYMALGEVRWGAEVVFVERLDFPYALLGRIGVFAQFNEVTFLEKVKTPRVEFGR
jgi:hypothetical protein